MGNLQIKKAVQTVFASKKAKIVAAFGVVVVVVAALVVGNGGLYKGDLSDFEQNSFDVAKPIFLAEAENQGSVVDKAVDPVKFGMVIFDEAAIRNNVSKGYKLDVNNRTLDFAKVANINANSLNKHTSNLFKYTNYQVQPKLSEVAVSFVNNFIKRNELALTNDKSEIFENYIVDYPFLGKNMLKFKLFDYDDKVVTNNSDNESVNTFEVQRGVNYTIKIDGNIKPISDAVRYEYPDSNANCRREFIMEPQVNYDNEYSLYHPYESLWANKKEFSQDNGSMELNIGEELPVFMNYLVYRTSKLPYRIVSACNYDGYRESIIESGFYYLIDQAGVVRIKTKSQPSASLVTGEISRPNLVYYTDAEQNEDLQTDDYLKVLYQGNNIAQGSTVEVDSSTVNLKLETASSKGLSAVTATFGNKNVLYRVYADSEQDDKLHQFIKIENVTNVAKDFFILVADDVGKSKTLGFKIKLNNSTPPEQTEPPANPQNPDSDGDGVVNERDNCPAIPNPGQSNLDGAADGGDACDEDDDNDGVLDALESPYPTPQNPDTDADGVVNERDNCPTVYNLGQTNSDNDALGNACDEDDDNDTVLDALDNCPTIANTDQADSDRDLVGNVCEGLVAETVNPIDLTFVPATPNIFKVDTKAPSNRVVVNLYNATTDSPIYTVDFHLSEGTTATTPLAVGQYNCVLLLGCNGFNGQVQSFTLPLNVPLYYKASIKLADGFTYSDRSENFVFTTLPTTPGQGVGGQDFTDVNQFDPNYVAVKYVAELGLMRGSNGLFRPYDQLTRAESFAISNRLSGANRGCQAYNPQFDGNLGFVDLFASINAPETYWYMTEIKCSRALGIVRGYADGTVKPLNAVNEAESVKVLLSAAAAGRALRATLPLVQGLENPWWLPYYEFLNRNSLNFPVNNGGQIITRGQFAQLVYALGNRGLIDANAIRSNLGLSPLSPNGTAGTTGSGFNNSIVLPPAR